VGARREKGTRLQFWCREERRACTPCGVRVVLVESLRGFVTVDHGTVEQTEVLLGRVVLIKLCKHR